ncbi:MAG: hypothetical protein ACJA2W_001490 [Planctomycetota bacterium]|jgi:hypothetical protein
MFPTLATAFVALAASDPVSTEAPAPVVVELAQSQAVLEYFLVSSPADGLVGEEGEPIAVVALRSLEHELPMKGFLLEREITFREGGLRIRHTETGEGSTRRLVWREFLPSASRTWIADWTAGERGGGVARSIAYGWNRPVHERVMTETTVERPVFGPLEVLHRTRAGTLTCGDAGGVIGVIDPSSAAIIDAERTALHLESGVSLDLRRPDGTLLLGADFSVGSQGMTSIRLSDREAVTRRIERVEFDRLSRRWKVESQRPYDAMLALIPTARSVSRIAESE